MGRTSLRIAIVLGIVMTVVGGTGIFAVFTDRSTAGENDASTGARARAVDIQIALGYLANPEHPMWDGIACSPEVSGAPFSDELITPQFVVSAVDSRSPMEQLTYLCLRNIGESPATLTARPIEIVETDVSCTGDEATAGDPTCGDLQVGELGGLVFTFIDRVVCNDPGSSIVYHVGGPLDAEASWDLTPHGAALPAGGVECLAIGLSYGGGMIAWQLAQSDRVTWRYAFDGQAN